MHLEFSLGALKRGGVLVVDLHNRLVVGSIRELDRAEPVGLLLTVLDEISKLGDDLVVETVADEGGRHALVFTH